MKIMATADMHGDLPKVPKCDLLLIAGDICPTSNHAPGYQRQWLNHKLRRWINRGYAEHVVAVAGNHDRVFALGEPPEAMPWTYLEGEEATVCGLRIWGGPWTPPIHDFWVFQADQEQARQRWARIPEGLDILISHGPPYGILDEDENDEPQGDKALRDAILRARPKMVVFGHIHTTQAIVERDGIIYANVSLLDHDYRRSKRHPVELPDPR